MLETREVKEAEEGRDDVENEAVVLAEEIIIKIGSEVAVRVAEKKA